MILDEVVTFGDSCLDRAVEIRTKPEIVKKLLTDKTTGILPFWRDKPLISGVTRNIPVWLSNKDLIFNYSNKPPLFLGLVDGKARFASDVSDWIPKANIDTVGTFSDKSEQHFEGHPRDYRFLELRSIMTQLNPCDAELTAMGKALINWHKAYQYCPSCGSNLVITTSGWQKECFSCKKAHFPRTDPVVIMLITKGNSVLMGRSHVWPKNMYSLLAGFVEPGETIEGAVRRETFEETGIRVSEVEYLCCQPWPFPASLMFGCKGVALSKRMNIDKEELEDAKWVNKEKMLDIFSGRNKSMQPARNGSIAHFLLRQWLKGKIK